MHNGNPHAPSTSWLDSAAHPHGGYNEAEPGDEGSELIERETGTFEVTVRKLPPEEPPREPVRDWVLENWHRLSLADDADVEGVTDRIVAAISEANNDAE